MRRSLLVNRDRVVSHSPPPPPDGLPDDLLESFEGYSPERLRHVARYAEELAEYREHEALVAESADDGEERDRPADLPDGVPSKATLTVKEINDNRYYYWQWRDGDKIRSKYEGPVGSDE
jgi:hypothetical protein